MPDVTPPPIPALPQSEEETRTIIHNALQALKANPVYQQLEPVVQEDTDKLVANELRQIAKDPFSGEEIRDHQRFLLEDRIPRHLEQMLSSKKANERMRSIWAKQRQQLGLDAMQPSDHMAGKNDRQR